MDTILIVDDEKNYPLILSAVLQEEGYEALTANSGEEALEIIDHSDVDLVLTDMKMPLMDGIELLEKIKDKDHELPVMMMTAHGTVEKAVENACGVGLNVSLTTSQELPWTPLPFSRG